MRQGSVGGLAFALMVTASCGTEPAPSACDEVEGRVYLSATERECGLGSEGTEYCHWQLEFETGDFEWHYSDVVESGTYTCEGFAIYGQTRDNQYSGTLDPDTSILAWEDVSYEPGP